MTPLIGQQRQELAPAEAVGCRIGILRRISAGGIQEDGLIGEPPVAVACATNAAQRSLADALLDRELQPRIDQRGGLARTGGADDHVPRQIVEAVPGPALLLQCGDRFVEPFAELLNFSGCPRLLRLRLCDYRRQQAIALAVRPHPVHELPREPGADDDTERDQTGGH
jgi:hypothetical protein